MSLFTARRMEINFHWFAKWKKHFLLDRSIAAITVFIEAISEDEQGEIWIG